VIIRNRQFPVRSRVLPIIFLFATASVSALFAGDDPKPGEPYALIFGTVWTKANQPASGIRIKIRRADKKKADWERVSDRRGEFAQRVPAGKAYYVVWADVKTPKGVEKPELTVQGENDERHDISLHLTE
jgi:hypothetical protein